MERYIPVPQTRPKPPRAWLLFLQAGYKRAVLGTTILSNGKEHFGLTDRNDQTGQRGPPLKLVPNIPVGPNRNGPFHLMYQPKLPEFWVEWKAPQVSSWCLAEKIKKLTDLYLQFSSKLQKVSINKSFIHYAKTIPFLSKKKKIYKRAMGRTLWWTLPVLNLVDYPSSHIKVYISGIFSKTKAYQDTSLGQFWSANENAILKVQLHNWSEERNLGDMADGSSCDDRTFLAPRRGKFVVVVFYYVFLSLFTVFL